VATALDHWVRRWPHVPAGDGRNRNRQLRQASEQAGKQLADGTLGHMDQGKLARHRHRYGSAVLIGKRQTASRPGRSCASIRPWRPGCWSVRTTTCAGRLIPPSPRSARPSADQSAALLRSMTGAEQFCAIRSYLSTAARHGLGKLQALALAATGTAWMPKAA
jgi:hypothetical protein